MAIASDFDRVFEVGPVFRAENSNTRRHLCEFVGLDLEMAISESYIEALMVCHKMFKHIFDGLEDRYAKEMAVIREQYHSEPVQFTDKVRSESVRRAQGAKQRSAAKYALSRSSLRCIGV